MSDELTFKKFSQANKLRSKEFFDKDNNSISHWAVCSQGEGFETIAEFATLFSILSNTVKKTNGELIDTTRDKLANEMADVVTYLFVKAGRFDIDLEKYLVTKFNYVSDKIGSDIKL